MIENKIEVKVYNVEGICNINDCNGILVENIPFIIWDNKNTDDLSDDTFMYSYKCPVCNSIQTSNIKYPYQEFVPVT